MKNERPRRAYTSQLRQARARDTRERILSALASWMEAAGEGELTFDAIAERAGVERRTVFRHFASKEALLAAFWIWINDRLVTRTLPESLDGLLAAPRETFARFDEQEGVIRASLHSAAGRAMRLAAVPARRQAFSAALDEATRDASPGERRRLEAVAHVLYSAAAWEAMRDYAGVSGAEAGAAAAWALGVLVDATRGRRGSDDAAAHPNEPAGQPIRDRPTPTS